MADIDRRKSPRRKGQAGQTDRVSRRPDRAGRWRRGRRHVFRRLDGQRQGQGRAGRQHAAARAQERGEARQRRRGTGSEGGGEGAKAATPPGEGGDKYASNYYAMDKEFTSNLQDSVHFIQVGIAVSTPYDDTRHREHQDQRDRGSLGDADGAGRHDRGRRCSRPRARSSCRSGWPRRSTHVLKEKEGFGGVGNVYFTNFVVQ